MPALHEWASYVPAAIWVAAAIVVIAGRLGRDRPDPVGSIIESIEREPWRWKLVRDVSGDSDLCRDDNAWIDPKRLTVHTPEIKTTIFHRRRLRRAWLAWCDWHVNGAHVPAPYRKETEA